MYIIRWIWLKKIWTIAKVVMFIYVFEYKKWQQPWKKTIWRLRQAEKKLCLPITGAIQARNLVNEVAGDKKSLSPEKILIKVQKYFVCFNKWKTNVLPV